MTGITINVATAIKDIVVKDLYSSKKYKLSLNLIMWSLACWGSIPDCAILVSTVIRNYQNKNIGKLVARFIADFFIMAVKFFIRRFGVVAVCYITS
jgi:hypothetical protein